MKNISRIINCPACGSRLDERGRIPDGILLVCKVCRSKKILIENYDQIKDESGYGDAYRKHLNETKTYDLLSLFMNNYKPVKNDQKLLDIGFGSGEFLLGLMDSEIQKYGLECDMNAVEMMKPKGVNAFFGELGGELNLIDKFDLITLWDVIEHINNIEKAVSQLSSLSNKNARLFILTPDSGSLFDTLANLERYLTLFKSQRIMSICLNKYHLHRFSVDGLRVLLERNGFIIERMHKIQLFSLNSDEYTNGFAPGIIKWTRSTVLNKRISRYAMNLIKKLNVKNKIFLTARRM